MTEPLTLEQANHLITLCRVGKLYEVEKWIASGKSIQMPPVVKKSPLQVAIDLGFHSLIDLLVRHEDSVAVKNRALSGAVSRRRLDLVELLVSHGAELRSIRLVDVLLTWEPSLIRFFLANDADAVTGAPFTVAFGEKVRTALRPFVEYKKTHPDLAPALQGQIDRALRHFSYEGDLKWVCLLLWAGANPRTRGSTLDDRWVDDPECHTTALSEACSKGNLEILKKLKPDPTVDNLSHLLSDAAWSRSREMVSYLLALGANPNDRTDGGCSAIDRCVWHFHFRPFSQFGEKKLSTRGDVSETFDCIRELVEHGAQWKPDRREMNSVRKALYNCEPVVTVDFVKLLARNKACPEERLEQLLDAPRMKLHLAPLGMRLTGGAAGMAKRHA